MSLNLGDLKNIIKIIDKASCKGSFKGNELFEIGILYNKITTIIKKVDEDTINTEGSYNNDEDTINTEGSYNNDEDTINTEGSYNNDDLFVENSYDESSEETDNTFGKNNNIDV